MLVFTALREIAHTQPSFKGPMGGGKFKQLEDGIICNERVHGREGSQFCLGSEGFTDERSFAVGFEGQVGVSWQRTWETSW